MIKYQILIFGIDLIFGIWNLKLKAFSSLYVLLCSTALTYTPFLLPSQNIPYSANSKLLCFS